MKKYLRGCSSGRELTKPDDDLMIAKFFTLVDRTDYCWLWKGTKGNGYGRFSYKGKNYSAHRLAYAIEYEKVPAGLLVCHRCDNTSCVNPKHLILGSQRENMLDAHKKDRAPTLPLGEKNPSSKISDNDAQVIRQLYMSGKYTQTQIAEKFGVGQPAIFKIINGERHPDEKIKKGFSEVYKTRNDLMLFDNSDIIIIQAVSIGLQEMNISNETRQELLKKLESILENNYKV